MRRRRPKKGSIEWHMLEEQRRRDRWQKMITKLVKKDAEGNRAAGRLASGFLNIMRGC